MTNANAVRLSILPGALANVKLLVIIEYPSCFRLFLPAERTKNAPCCRGSAAADELTHIPGLAGLSGRL